MRDYRAGPLISVLIGLLFLVAALVAGRITK